MRNLPVGNGRASGIPGPVGGAPDAGAPPAAAAVADPRRGPPPGWRPTPVQAAFLDTVAARESGGRYNIRYSPSGGTLFQGYNQHPRVAEPGPHGPSTAAGRYQFTYDTWKRVAGENTPFTPVNQDYYALKLAEQRYGPNLWNDLERGGLTRDVLQKLAPTWAAFRDPNAYNRLADVYASSYAYYTGASR
jgi:muramidase (phage lysozyme)